MIQVRILLGMAVLLTSIQQPHMCLSLYLALDLALTLYLWFLFVKELILDVVVMIVV
jgi:hypothetical protein